MSAASHFTSGELGVQAWKISRLFELGVLNEPARVDGRRLIPRAMIPEVIDALRARGWLPMEECRNRCHDYEQSTRWLRHGGI